MTDLPNDAESFLCTSSELCYFYGLSYDTLRKRTALPDFPEDAKVGLDLYDLKIINDWTVEHFYSSESKGRKNQMAEEKLRYQKYKADKEEFDAKQRSKELLPIKDIQNGLSFLLSGLKTKLMMWIKRLPPLLVNQNEKEISAIIKKELFAILSDLATGVKALTPKKKRGRKKKKK